MDLQIQALERLGCRKVFTDHGVSGSATSRPGLDRVMTRLKPGDKLVVWRLDRLGRSLVHLVSLLESLGRREIRFQSVTEHIDTSSPGGRLVFHMMAALAEFERALISERTRAGMAAARNNGKRLGRRPLLSQAQVDEARQLIDSGKWHARDVARHLGVHPRTVARMLAKDEVQGQR